MLEVQLKHGNIQEKLQALDRFPEFGQKARPLIPVVLGMFEQRPSWLTPSMLVKLLEATREVVIVQVLQNANLLHALEIWDQVVCFRHGAEELEPDLLRYLYQHRHAPGNPARPEVVKALGDKGGQETLKMMKALLAELAEYNELQANNVLENFETKAQVSLREEIRKAIRQLGQRGIR